MNGVSRTTMVYLFNILTYIELTQVSVRVEANKARRPTMVLHVNDLATAGPNWTNAQLD